MDSTSVYTTKAPMTKAVAKENLKRIEDYYAGAEVKLFDLNQNVSANCRGSQPKDKETGLFLIDTEKDCAACQEAKKEYNFGAELFSDRDSLLNIGKENYKEVKNMQKRR